MKKKGRCQGFSLVELIIVMAITAILAGLLATNFLKYVGEANEAKCLGNIDELREAVASDVAGGKDAEESYDDWLNEEGDKIECRAGGEVYFDDLGDGDPYTYRIDCTSHHHFGD